MKRVFKWILAVVATLALLVLVVSITLPLLLDPNDYKDRISALVSRETGRELAIKGDISWRVFPALGIELNELSLANRPGFGERPMLEIARTSVTVEMLPLFSRRLEVGRIGMDGISANLRSNTDGQNNWQDLVEKIRGSSITQAVEPGQTTNFEVEVSAGQLNFESTARRVALDGLQNLTAVDQVAQAFELDGEAMLEFPLQELSGQISAVALLQHVGNTGLIGIQDLDTRFNGIQGQADAGIPVNFQSSMDIVVDLVRNQAAVTDMVAQLFDLRAVGSVDIADLSGETTYNGRLELPGTNPKQLLQDAGLAELKTRKPEALTHLQAEMSFSGSQGQVEIPDLSIVLDSTSLGGQLAIESFNPLQMIFDLDVDTLNLDDYSLLSGPEDESGEVSEVGGAGLLVGSMLFLTGGGDLDVGRLVMNGLTVEDVSVHISSGDDGIRLFPMSSSFYGGQHQGDIQVGFDTGVPILTASQVLTGFEVSSVLKDLAGYDRLHGTGDIYLKVRTQLGSALQARQALSGDIGISVIDGVIDDIDVPGAVTRIASLLGYQDIAGDMMPASDRMEFTELIVTGMINKGIVQSDDLMLNSMFVNATGQGSVNLVNETLNYTLYPLLANELRAQTPAELRDVSIPVKVTGKLYSPNLSVDLNAGLSSAQKAQIANKAGELSRALLEGLRSDKKDQP